jgi:hypothetical protein
MHSEPDPEIWMLRTEHIAIIEGIRDAYIKHEGLELEEILRREIQFRVTIAEMALVYISVGMGGDPKETATDALTVLMDGVIRKTKETNSLQQDQTLHNAINHLKIRGIL